MLFEASQRLVIYSAVIGVVSASVSKPCTGSGSSSTVSADTPPPSRLPLAAAVHAPVLEGPNLADSSLDRHAALPAVSHSGAEKMGRSVGYTHRRADCTRDYAASDFGSAVSHLSRFLRCLITSIAAATTCHIYCHLQVPRSHLVCFLPLHRRHVVYSDDVSFPTRVHMQALDLQQHLLLTPKTFIIDSLYTATLMAWGLLMFSKALRVVT